MIKTNQNGFSPVALIVAVLAVLTVGIIAWRLWDANQQSQQSDSAQQIGNSLPHVDLNEGFVVIKEWGVRFKPTEELTGVRYFKPQHVLGDQLTFTTTGLASAYEGCREDSKQIVLGLITRSHESDPQYGGVLAKIGDYTYQYRGPEAACSTSNYEAESKILVSLMKSLESLEAAK